MYLLLEIGIVAGILLLSQLISFAISEKLSKVKNDK
jgi:hypothetical protein